MTANRAVLAVVERGKEGLCLKKALQKAWRSGMGIEPTLDGTTAQHRF